MSRERLQQHTSGPWAITDRPDPDRAEPEFFNIESGTENDDGWIVARVWADAPELSLRADANARLIAAAPDLLEALDRLTGEVRACWGMEADARAAFGNTNYTVVAERLDAALSAIAKATAPAIVIEPTAGAAGEKV